MPDSRKKPSGIILFVSVAQPQVYRAVGSFFVAEHGIDRNGLTGKGAVDREEKRVVFVTVDDTVLPNVTLVIGRTVRKSAQDSVRFKAAVNTLRAVLSLNRGGNF